MLQIYLCEIGGGGINNGVYDIVLATSLLVKAGKNGRDFKWVFGQIEMDMIAFAFTYVFILGKT